jgi:hypothetical protein
MLRGRRSCTISERPTTLSRALFPKPVLCVPVPSSSSSSGDCRLPATGCFSPLSPTIPVHPGNPPVSSIIPVHTQKQGDVPHFSALPLHSSSVLSLSSVVNPFSAAADSNRLKILSASCELSSAGCFFPYFPYDLSPISLLICRFPDAYRKTTGVGGTLEHPTFNFEPPSAPLSAPLLATKSKNSRPSYLFSRELWAFGYKLSFSPNSNFPRTSAKQGAFRECAH